MQTSSQPESKLNQWIILILIVASYFMLVVGVSIVITGLPKIQQELSLSTTSLSWVQNAYTLTFGGLLLVGARAGDIFGRRRMYLVGLGLFTLASAMIGFASSAAGLLLFRAVQGAGAAILAPTTMALISTNFAEGEARTRALSYHAAAAGIGATFGLVIGGVFADMLSWRVGFLINVPIGMVLIAGTLKYIKESARQAGRLGWLDAVSSTAGMVALVFGIVHAAETSWDNQWTVLSLLFAVVLLLVFLVNQAKTTHPVLPLRLFGNRKRNGAYLGRLFFMAGIVGFWFFTTQFLQGVLGFSPLQAGAAFLPATLLQVLGSMLTPRLSRQFGGGIVITVNLVIAMLGLYWLGLAAPHSSYWSGVALPMLLIGFSNGALLAPLTVAAMQDVPSHDAGAASGVVNVIHQMGASLGLSILVLVFSMAASTQQAQTDKLALAYQISCVLHTSVLLLLMALLVVVFMILIPRRQQPVVMAE